MATTIQEALAICNANLTGDLKTDIPYLEGQVRRYAHEPNGEELAKRITELAFSLLPKEQQDQFMTATTLNGKRLSCSMRHGSCSTRKNTRRQQWHCVP